VTEEGAASLPARQSPFEIALEFLQRAAALACLVYGVGYWVRLLGFYEGPEWRFDLMPVYWQLAATPLAVMFPSRPWDCGCWPPGGRWFGSPVLVRRS